MSTNQRRMAFCIFRFISFLQDDNMIILTYCIRTYMDVSENSGTPQIIHFSRVFHYKPSILGYPYFWKHPYHFQQLTFASPLLLDLRWLGCHCRTSDASRRGEVWSLRCFHQLALSQVLCFLFLMPSAFLPTGSQLTELCSRHQGTPTFTSVAMRMQRKREKKRMVVPLERRRHLCFVFFPIYVVCSDRMMGALEASGIGSEAGVHR